MEIGAAHHKFLQHVLLTKASDAAVLKAEALRLEQERILTADEASVLDIAALTEFWQSKLGAKIRAQTQFVRRELPFTTRFSPAELDALLGRSDQDNPSGEFVVVQGVADLAVLLEQEIWLLDFKTDELNRSEVEARAKLYEPQLRLYALGLGRIYERPVTECWLHFLGCRQSFRVQQPTGARE